MTSAQAFLDTHLRIRISLILSGPEQLPILGNTLPHLAYGGGSGNPPPMFAGPTHFSCVCLVSVQFWFY